MVNNMKSRNKTSNKIDEKRIGKFNISNIHTFSYDRNGRNMNLCSKEIIFRKDRITFIVFDNYKKQRGCQYQLSIPLKELRKLYNEALIEKENNIKIEKKRKKIVNNQKYI